MTSKTNTFICVNYQALCSLKELLYSNGSANTFPLIFSLDVELIRNLLAVHGVNTYLFSLSECQNALVLHILTGACTNFIFNSPSSQTSVSVFLCPSTDVSACHQISVTFKFASDACAVIDLIVSSDSDLVCNGSLYNYVHIFISKTIVWLLFATLLWSAMQHYIVQHSTL